MRVQKSMRSLLIGACASVIAIGGGLLLYPLPSSPSAPQPTSQPEPTVQAQAAPAPAPVVEPAPPAQTVVAAEVGDTLMDLLLRAGMDRAEAVKAVDALSEVYDPRALKIGQAVTVTFERSSQGSGQGPVHAISLQPDASRQVSANRAKGGYAASEIRRQETRQLARFAGTIKGSLFESAMAEGVPAPILVEMIRAFSYDVDFQRDIQRGDGFEVVFERFVDNRGQTIRDGDILFASLTLSGDAMPIFRYVDSRGTTDYYNAQGESVKKALLRTPVDGARISSSFGMRTHPILGFSKMHKGVDFAVGTGTPVMAAGAGTIELAGANGSYGYYVRIRHDNRHSTAYAHLSRFVQGIRAGKRVAQGQIIAYSGATGRATGPHLHYEVLVDNAQVNPLSVKFQSGNKLAGAELQRFQGSIKATNAFLVQLPVSHRVAMMKSGPGTAE